MKHQFEENAEYVWICKWCHLGRLADVHVIKVGADFVSPSVEAHAIDTPCGWCGKNRCNLAHDEASVKFDESGDPHTVIADVVNHPSHYSSPGGFEAIKVIEAWELGFCLGNTVKYISRAGKKGGPDKTIEDLKKAARYLARHIDNLENDR